MCLSELSSTALGPEASGSRVLFAGPLEPVPLHPFSSALDRSRGVYTQMSPPEVDVYTLTMPAAATPRSRPSSNEHALHRSLLDIYPHRLHVSTAPSVSSGPVQRLLAALTL